MMHNTSARPSPTTADTGDNTSRFRLTLSPDEYETVKPNMALSKPVLRGNWKKLMYDKFKHVWPTCPVIFNYAHVRLTGSRKGNCRFWRGTATCTGCIKAQFSIEDLPVEGQDVVVDVVVKGLCTHAPSTRCSITTVLPSRRGRPLSAVQRTEVASKIVAGATTPTKEFYGKLATMPDAAVEAGNTAKCHTKAVFRQAAHEFRMKQELHPDPVIELRLQRKDWMAAERTDDAALPGYIQVIGDTPFFCSCYLLDQVKLYIDCCAQDDGGVLHVDATGTVVKDIADQKRILYYSFVPQSSNVSVLDFLSSRHTTETLTFLIEQFNRDVRLYNSGHTVQPRYVVTDLSYAVINAVLSAFNKCTLLTYLKAAMEVLEGRQTCSVLTSRTYVCLCIAHMMKCLSCKLYRLLPSFKNKGKRQTVLTLFATLARTTSIAQASEVYRSLYVLLCSTARSSSVEKSKNFLESTLEKLDVGQGVTEAEEDVQLDFSIGTSDILVTNTNTKPKCNSHNYNYK